MCVFISQDQKNSLGFVCVWFKLFVVTAGSGTLPGALLPGLSRLPPSFTASAPASGARDVLY